MKKLKRLLTIGVAVALMFCMSLSFVGCKKEPVIGPIPDGRYAYSMTNYDEYVSTYIYTEGNKGESYWIIEGDHAESWSSGSRGMKAKIIEKDGKIYFEEDGWGVLFDILFFGLPWEYLGRSYLVEYDEQGKSFTFDYYTKYYIK